MPHRRFRDTQGVEWNVWEVRPQGLERRRTPVASKAAERTVERRRHPEFRVSLGMSMSKGWLVFDSSSEKRRLAPIPSDWNLLSEHDLGRLCRDAVAVPQRWRAITRELEQRR